MNEISQKELIMATQIHSPLHKNEMRWNEGILQLSPKYFTRFFNYTHFAWARQIDYEHTLKQRDEDYSMHRVLSPQETSRHEFNQAWEETQLSYSEGWFVFNYLVRNHFNGQWTIVKSIPTKIEVC